MSVDGYRYLPRRLANAFRAWEVERLEPIP